MMHGARGIPSRHSLGLVVSFFIVGLLFSGGVVGEASPAEGEIGAAGPPVSLMDQCKNASGPSLAGVDCDRVFVEVSAGYDFYCALSSTGKVYCWGDNSQGQVGTKGRGVVSRPVEVSGLGGRVAKIAAGHNHACAVMAEGPVKCWGENLWGQLGNGTRKRSYTPVAVSGLGEAVEEISAGEGHSCVIVTGGSVRCWGNNRSGQLGDGSFKRSGTPVEVSGLPGPVHSLSAGALYNCAITAEGALWCWGDNARGQLGDLTHDNSARPVAVKISGPSVLRVSAGRLHTCAVTDERKLMCWGGNDWGQLGNLRHTDRLKPDYVLSAEGTESVKDDIPIQLVADVVTSEDRTYIITEDGTVKYCGYIETFHGTQHYKISWYQAVVDFSPPVRHMVMVAAGGNMSLSSACGITVDGEVQCWGSGYEGRLGNGSNEDVNVPSSPVWP